MSSLDNSSGRRAQRPDAAADGSSRGRRARHVSECFDVLSSAAARGGALKTLSDSASHASACSAPPGTEARSVRALALTRSSRRCVRAGTPQCPRTMAAPAARHRRTGVIESREDQL
jgi:hypothetical protein